MLGKFCERPSGLTEVRRDGKDDDAIVGVIKEEYQSCKEKGLSDEQIDKHMEIFASGCWVCNFL